MEQEINDLHKKIVMGTIPPYLVKHILNDYPNNLLEEEYE